jgi:hypothetical protein
VLKGMEVLVLVAGRLKACSKVILAGAFAPLAEFTYRITLVKIKLHPINGCPRAYYHMYPYISFADYKRPPSSFKVRTQSCHREVPRQLFGDIRRAVEHNATILSPLRPSMQKPAASLESHNLPRAASSRRQGRAL